MKTEEIYILLDVGGTSVKCGAADRNGCFLWTEPLSFPAKSKAGEEEVFDNFVTIIEKAIEKAETAEGAGKRIFADTACVVRGVGMAFPGPFDYDRGISLMRGLNKYDSIYGIPIGPELQSRSGRLGTAEFVYLHDIEAFAVGESIYGAAKDTDRFLCLCIGTGAGSAFVEGKRAVKSGDGVPAGGWLYNTPFKASVIDDYLSVRGLLQLSGEMVGERLSGLELCRRCEQGDPAAIACFSAFGENVSEAIMPFLDRFKPQAVVMGGQISKSFCWFGAALLGQCEERGIRIFLETETSVRAMQGLYSTMERGVKYAES